MSLAFAATIVVAGLPMQTGDLPNGTRLVASHCKSCKAEVLFDPIRLNDVGERKVIKALARGKGIGPLEGWDGRRLSALEAWDVLTYIRSRSITLRDLIPGVTHFAAFEPEPNEYARQRLYKQAKVFSSSPKPEEVKGKVILTWTDPEARGPVRNLTGNRVAYEDMDQKHRSGWIILRQVEEGKRQVFLGVAIDIKDTKIIAAKAVPADGKKSSSAMRAVARGCKNKGRRDNYRRFSCNGSGRLAKPIFKAFIIASEQIYAYEYEEHRSDFTSGLADDE
ncbi:MAG: hypothetical protein CMH55_02320 [Myxococcales bacterium]|nr:hypothetical protein [Myxococcales bacterium]|tara:strand:+ start:1721 stop:2557 length:837 start_codon:yes stop_codon:yes gene_type:complete